MRLSVLSENKAMDGFYVEHGLSYFIETSEKSFLFDTGASDVYLKNADKLGLDLHKDAHTIVLSHGHWDHGDGLQFIKNKTLIAHPSFGMNRFRRSDNSSIGLKLSSKELNERFTVITSKKPYNISDNIIFLGEIPRINDFESQSTSFIDAKGKPDFVPDDSALAIIKDNELIVVTGCSHAGICNIVEHAKQVTKIRNIKAVIGGFHLKRDNKQTGETIAYLKKHNVEQLYPSHCTQQPALNVVYTQFEERPVKAGMVLNF